MQYRETWFDQHPALMWCFLVYIVISGLMLFADIRKPLMKWYRSQGWLISGQGPIDILFKQIGYRFTVELFAFGVACLLGSLGGNIYVIMKAKNVRRVGHL